MLLCICDPLEIASYCQTASLPSLANANAAWVASSLVVYGIANYTCSLGYASTGGSTAPYAECLQDTTSYGMWSAITYSCARTHPYV